MSLPPSPGDRRKRRPRRRRHPQWMLDALAQLPMTDSEIGQLERRVVDRDAVSPADAVSSADALPEQDPASADLGALLETQSELALLRRANATARALASLDELCPVPALELAPEHDGVVQRILASEGQRAEERLEALLRDTLGPVIAPAGMPHSAFADLSERVIEDSERSLRAASPGDLIAAGFAPLTAPGDVDWAAAALESFEIDAPSISDFGSGAEAWRTARSPGADPVSTGDRAARAGAISFGRLGSSRAPGWLWARIRSDVRSRVGQLQRRRRAVIRSVLVAAVLFVSGLVWLQISSASTKPNIVFQRVDTPLSAQFSTSALIRSIRRGS